jgi:hypothetical protein
MAVKKGKRELIDTGRDKRYVKRNTDGTFKDAVDVAWSMAHALYGQRNSFADSSK